MDEIVIPEPPLIELPHFVGPDPNMVINFPPIIFGPTVVLTEEDLKILGEEMDNKDGFQLTKEQLSELWRQCVHNKAFQLVQDCQDLRAALEVLSPPEITIYDKFNVFERQLRVVESELKRLTEYVNRIKMPFDL